MGACFYNTVILPHQFQLFPSSSNNLKYVIWSCVCKVVIRRKNSCGSTSARPQALNTKPYRHLIPYNALYSIPSEICQRRQSKMHRSTGCSFLKWCDYFFGTLFQMTRCLNNSWFTFPWFTLSQGPLMK
jgi:hypothetical protein